MFLTNRVNFKPKKNCGGLRPPLMRAPGIQAGMVQTVLYNCSTDVDSAQYKDVVVENMGHKFVMVLVTLPPLPI